MFTQPFINLYLENGNTCDKKKKLANNRWWRNTLSGPHYIVFTCTTTLSFICSLTDLIYKYRPNLLKLLPDFLVDSCCCTSFLSLQALGDATLRASVLSTLTTSISSCSDPIIVNDGYQGTKGETTSVWTVSTNWDECRCNLSLLH